MQSTSINYDDYFSAITVTDVKKARTRKTKMKRENYSHKKWHFACFHPSV